MQKRWEIKVTVRLTGWENVPADTKEEAEAWILKRMDERFSVEAPLLNVSYYVKALAKRG